MHGTVARLRQAMNGHDARAVAALFAPAQRSDPAPTSGMFGGGKRAMGTWDAIFSGVPDLTAHVVAESSDGRTSRSQWVWRGTRPDGAPFALRGVVILGLRPDGLIAWARFEPAR